MRASAALLLVPAPTSVAAGPLVLPVAPGSPPAVPAGVLALLPPAWAVGLADAVAQLGVVGSVAAPVRPVLVEPGALVHLVGVGEQTTADLRRAAGASIRAAGTTAATITSYLAATADSAGIRAVVEGSLLAAYRFSLRSTPDPTPPGIEVVVADVPAATTALATGRAVATATCWARDLANMPASVETPEWLAQQARQELTGPGLTVTVLGPGDLTAFGGLRAVGGGSASGPRLIEVRYRPAGARGGHVVLVGKGITFDTGGISIKPNEGMHLMKTDMAGGAAVLGAIRAAAELALPLDVTVLVPAAENHVSGSAYRPGDVVRHWGGRTTEIRNTDAEGRLVLADALAYAAATLDPDVLIDVATLTGAMKLTLGVGTAGVLGSDPGVVAGLLAAATEAGEPMWELPLLEDHADLIGSPIADANNAAGNPGAITAALFLRPFAGGRAWAHLDIAGPARATADTAEISRGGTGYGVRTLVAYLEQRVRG